MSSLKCKTPETPPWERREASLMPVQGIVTRVEISLLFFEVNDKIRIYVNLANEAITFPSKGDTVEIKNLLSFTKKLCNILVMGPETTYTFPTSNTEGTARQLYWTLRRNNMLEYPNVLLRTDKFISKLGKDFSPMLISKILCKFVEKYKTTNVDMKVADDMNCYVNENYTNCYDSLTFEKSCTFNVYPSRISDTSNSELEILCGILDVDKTTGHFCLRNEENYKLVVKFKPSSGNIHQLRNTVVMIRKWTLFTELFDLPGALTLQYILVDFEDVEIVERVQKKLQHFYGKDETCPINTPEFELFLVEKLSEPIFGYDNQPECWMEGSLLNVMNNIPQRVYLCWPNVQVVPFLKENVVYKMFGPRRIRTDKNRQLFGLRTKNPTFNIHPDTIFQETATAPGPRFESEKILRGMLAAKQYMKQGISPNEYFSIIIKISRKSLQQYSANFKPHHPRRFKRPMPYFGNPDDDHQMMIDAYDWNKGEYLDLYVNQRDNSVTPLGLLEDMVVKITHVQQSNNRYLRSTTFTSYELCEYAPKIPFCSVPLRVVNWDHLDVESIPSTELELGMVERLPRTCVIKSRCKFQSVSELTIMPLCNDCKALVRANKECSACEIRARDIHVEMVVRYLDASDFTVPVQAGKDLFFELLGKKEEVDRQAFKDELFSCERMKIDFTKVWEFDPEAVTTDLKISKVLTAMVARIHSDNVVATAIHDVVCVKTLNYPPWNLLRFGAIWKMAVSVFKRERVCSAASISTNRPRRAPADRRLQSGERRP